MMRNIIFGSIAVIALISVLSVQHFSIFAQELPTDQKNLNDLIAKSLDYVHKADISTSAQNILLHGINLSQGEFVFLYDSTPFASKGHLAANLPCDPKNPNDALFDILVGQAPDLFVMPLGYIGDLSTPGKMCVYHGQFGFGDPVSDIVLKYVGDDPIKLEGPHSIVLSTHEYYTPSTKSFEMRQHTNMTGQ